MKLLVNNRLIRAPIDSILNDIVAESKIPYFRDRIKRGGNILVTCPFHKNGNEEKPSCSICANSEDDVPFGTYHCWSCGASGSLVDLVAKCFHVTTEQSKEWVSEKYGNTFIEEQEFLPSIEPVKKTFMDEAILDNFTPYTHPYMNKRKITEHVRKTFKIGYNRANESIVFPVWDEKNNLLFITQRSVKTKFFQIPEGIDKPVYLLNFIYKFGFDTAIVVESQINCLTCWGYHLPSVALFGTGTKEQVDILNKSPIRNYILCFDGDNAGRKGAERFKKYIRKDVLVTDIVMPNGKDVNDLDAVTLYNLLADNDIDGVKIANSDNMLNFYLT